MPEREPTVEELVNRQQKLEQDQRDAWRHIHDTRDRVAAAEQGMERLWGEVHEFRRESREDAHQLTESINHLAQNMAKKADQQSDDWRRQVDQALFSRQGRWSVAKILLGLVLPGLGALAGAVYYIAELM